METRLQTRTVCPPELDQAIPAKPRPSAGAIVRLNPEGQAFLVALSEAFDVLADLFADARAACPKPSSSGPVARPPVAAP